MRRGRRRRGRRGRPCECERLSYRSCRGFLCGRGRQAGTGIGREDVLSKYKEQKPSQQHHDTDSDEAPANEKLPSAPKIELSQASPRQ